MTVPVAILIDWWARILPQKEQPVPNVTELPTAQNTFRAFAPLVKMTRRPVVMVSVDAI
jgi:hypothetical protein